MHVANSFSVGMDAQSARDCDACPKKAFCQVDEFVGFVLPV